MLTLLGPASLSGADQGARTHCRHRPCSPAPPGEALRSSPCAFPSPWCWGSSCRSFRPMETSAGELTSAVIAAAGGLRPSARTARHPCLHPGAAALPALLTVMVASQQADGSAPARRPAPVPGPAPARRYSRPRRGPRAPHPPGFPALLCVFRMAAFLVGMVYPMFESFKVRGRAGQPPGTRSRPAMLRPHEPPLLPAPAHVPRGCSTTACRLLRPCCAACLTARALPAHALSLPMRAGHRVAHAGRRHAVADVLGVLLLPAVHREGGLGLPHLVRAPLLSRAALSECPAALLRALRTWPEASSSGEKLCCRAAAALRCCLPPRVDCLLKPAAAAHTHWHVPSRLALPPFLTLVPAARRIPFYRMLRVAILAWLALPQLRVRAGRGAWRGAHHGCR